MLIDAAVHRIVASLAFLTAITAATTAQAETPNPRGTFFLLELSTGLSESAYLQGDPALAYGLTGGLTFKLKKFPVRFHVLTTFLTRASNASGAFEGVPYSTSRRDLDLYLAARMAMPLFAGLRLYTEVGAGHRWASADLHRGAGLGDLAVDSSRTLVVLAAGFQYRLTDNVSLGVRGELTPGGTKSDIISEATGADLSTDRASFMAQLGFHF